MVSVLGTCPFPVSQVENWSTGIAAWPGASSKQALMNHPLSNPPPPKMWREVAVTVSKAKPLQNKDFSSAFFWSLPDFILRKMILRPSTICHFELLYHINIFWTLFSLRNMIFSVQEGKNPEAFFFLKLEIHNLSFLLMDLKHFNEFNSEVPQIIYLYPVWEISAPQEETQRTLWAWENMDLQRSDPSPFQL